MTSLTETHESSKVGHWLNTGPYASAPAEVTPDESQKNKKRKQINEATASASTTDGVPTQVPTQLVLQYTNDEFNKEAKKTAVVTDCKIPVILKLKKLMDEANTKSLNVHDKNSEEYLYYKEYFTTYRTWYHGELVSLEKQLNRFYSMVVSLSKQGDYAALYTTLTIIRGRMNGDYGKDY